jgi:hypothetical protein
MTAQLWRAAEQLATVWRSSAYVQEYIAGARGLLAQCTGTGADHIAAQPFYLAIYLPTAMTYNQAAEPPGWRDKAVQIANGYTAMVEWLRSRLPGYPFPGAPQLTPPSPWTTFTVSMQVPWLADPRSWQLQYQPQPPTMPFLPDRPAQAKAGAGLGAAVASSPAAAEAGRRWNALTASDKRQLEAASAAMQQARYPEPDDVRGDEDFRQLGWSDYILDDTLRSLSGRARAFADALTSADRQIQQAAALFSQLVMFGQIRQLAHIGYVDQLDGPDGWHTARSGSYVFEPIRVREIIGFDDPYPRGLMLVEGITEHLPIEPNPGSVTVHGRILADSEDLAASAVPIQPVFVAPDEG